VDEVISKDPFSQTVPSLPAKTSGISCRLIVITSLSVPEQFPDPVIVIVRSTLPLVISLLLGA